jgi:NADH:ubiquinone reductase (H+-translocating)
MKAHRIERVAVVGGGYAGVMAANRIARVSQDRIRITLVVDAEHFVERIRLHQLVAGSGTATRPWSELLHRSVVVRRGLVVRVEPSAAELDRGPQVVLDDGEVIGADRVVLAVGSCSTPLGTAFDASNESGARRAKGRLALLGKGGRVVVIGGGLTAFEVVTELTEQQPALSFTLVAPQLFAGLSAAAIQRAERALKVHGVTHMRDRAKEVTEGAVLLASGRRLASDMTLWCGALRAPPLATKSGLLVDEHGRLVVDEFQRSRTDPTIYGVGDCAAHPANRRMSCQSAMPSGAAAADAILSEHASNNLRPFTMKYTTVCISDGRRSGIVQLVCADDRAIGPPLAGRAAALVKEKVCASTVQWMVGEADGKAYRWRR